MCGSYNILFPIIFEDGKTWLLKVPDLATPGNFGPKAAKIMQPEVMAARFLKRKTKIPVPTVCGYDITFDNEIQSPYIMMEMLRGMNLSEALLF